MGRKRQAKLQTQQAQRQDQPRTRKPYRAASDTDAVEASRSDIEIILNLPRLARIALILVPTFALVVVLQPLIDAIYLRYFFTMETRNTPSLVMAALTLLFFLAGWMLVVGNVGETPPAGRAVRVYLYASIALVLFAVLWLGYLLFNNMLLGG